MIDEPATGKLYLGGRKAPAMPSASVYLHNPYGDPREPPDPEWAGCWLEQLIELEGRTPR